MGILFKSITEMGDMQQINQLLRKIWGKENGITPYLLTAQTHLGGLIIGAYIRNELIGVSYGFPGISEDKEVFFYSHLLGVLAPYNGKGFATRLKEEQAKYALEKGYNEIRWTFDPLESKNAHLNINKLGVISNQYVVNFYGEMDDPLNRGIMTDRLLVEWHLIDSPKSLLVLQHCTPVIKVVYDKGIPFCSGWLRTGDKNISIAIPARIQTIKEISMSCARSWRDETREAIMFYFQKGYQIVAFDHVKDRDVQYYLFSKRYL